MNCLLRGGGGGQRCAGGIKEVYRCYCKKYIHYFPHPEYSMISLRLVSAKLEGLADVGVYRAY